MLDISKADKGVGVKARPAFEAGLRKTIDRYVKNQVSRLNVEHQRGARFAGLPFRWQSQDLTPQLSISNRCLRYR